MSEIGQKMIEIVRAKAARNPLRVYQKPAMWGDYNFGGSSHKENSGSCVYVYDAQPSCIIGQALWGVEAINFNFELSRYNTSRFSELPFIISKLEVLDRDERDWLQRVQNGQDKLEPWGVAVELADRAHDAIGIAAIA